MIDGDFTSLELFLRYHAAQNGWRFIQPLFGEQPLLFDRRELSHSCL